MNNNFNNTMNSLQQFMPMNNYQYGQAVGTPKMTQPVSEEWRKKLQGQTGVFSLQFEQKDFVKASCTHKWNNKLVLMPDNEGYMSCPICGERFHLLDDLSDQQIQELTDNWLDVLQTIKTIYLDISPEVAEKYFQFIPLLKKLPDLYKLANRNLHKYDPQGGMQQYGSGMNAFNTLSALTGPSMGNPLYQQQYNMGMMNNQGTFNPAMQNGMMNMGYQQPYGQPQGFNYNMMGNNGMNYGQQNPFGYNGGVMQDPNQMMQQQQQVQQNTVQQQQTPAQGQAQDQSNGTVVNSKIFNA